MMSVQLPMLAGQTAALETCGYCPKLCRAACPVSEAEPRDSLTPWGKMSVSWLASRGDVEPDREIAATAWACTGCYACRERCDHRNQVAHTLGAARADYLARGLAPAAAGELVERFAEMTGELSSGIAELGRGPGVSATASTALLLGCRYVRKAPELARAALAVVERLFGPVRLVDGCCGAPLLHAGDFPGFENARERVRVSVEGAARFVVVDPGCAVVLRDAGAITLVEAALGALDAFGRVPELEGLVRWHDPCQLGRGLGLYDAPRALLTRALGRAPDEFAWRRERAVCSGAGGMLPLSMPEASRTIAERRLAEHERLGGGLLVTGCASGTTRFRRLGARVMDLVAVLEASSRPRNG
jgi:fumarate reductase (CoM/CoB) subunit B